MKMTAMRTALLVVLLALAGCSKQTYSLEVWNTSEDKLTEVEVWYGKKHAQFGIVPPGKSGVRHFMYTPPTNPVEVRWVDSTGQRLATQVDVSSVLPRRYNDGQLTFRIRPGNKVTAHYQEPFDIF